VKTRLPEYIGASRDSPERLPKMALRIQIVNSLKRHEHHRKSGFLSRTPKICRTLLQFEIDIDKLKDLPAALSSKQKRSGYRIDLIGTCSMNNLMRFLLNH
jgi:hypothetical protein